MSSGLAMWRFGCLSESRLAISDALSPQTSAAPAVIWGSKSCVSMKPGHMQLTVTPPLSRAYSKAATRDMPAKTELGSRRAEARRAISASSAGFLGHDDWSFTLYRGEKEAMVVLRLVKVVLVASTAVHALLIAFDNVVDYDANYAFVRHTLSMDTTFPDSAIRGRAITSPEVWTFAYWLIIAVEAAVGLLLLAGAFQLAAALRADARRFQAAKRLVALGVGLGFLLWFTGFMVVGGEWFAMWQSKTWNGQEAAFRFYATFLLVLIFVNQRDGEIQA